MMFSDIKEVQRAHATGAVDLQAKVKVRIREVQLDDDGNRTEIISVRDTTVGRALIWDIVPDGLPFELVNQDMKKWSYLT